MSRNKVLTVVSLVMINISLICSLRGLPMMAEYGTSIIFYLLVAVLIFLVPSSLISAELATGWPRKGGVYVWVKEAFGERWGFMAVWLQWVQNLVFYPTALSATAAVLAYLIYPELANNAWYTIIVILIVYWGATLFNFKGMKASSTLTTIGTICGILIPGVVVITSVITWYFMGFPTQISFNWQSLIPDFSNISNVVFLSGIFLFFAGMEVSGAHAQDVKNPQKDYPKAIFISALVIITIFALGSLAVAAIIPADHISLTAGIMQTFTTVFDKFSMSWMVPVIALLAAPGMITQVSTWIAGPSKGLLATADDGNLPKFFQHKNKNGVPTNILLVQGSIVTIVSLVFLLMPSVSSSFWILTALTAQLYLLMYILMFAAAIKLRYSRAYVHRAYKVPWGMFGIWLVGGVGILGAAGAIALGFVPPSQLQTGGYAFFAMFLILGILLLAGTPIAIIHFKNPKWMPSEKERAGRDE